MDLPTKPAQGLDMSHEQDIITFINAKLILPTHATPVLGSLSFSSGTGLITAINTEPGAVSPGARSYGSEINLHNQILAPGFIDLQTNGMAGVHFTTLATGSKSGAEPGEDDISRLEKCAKLLVTSGTTAFWATIPTVPQHRWREILPVLRPREFTQAIESSHDGVTAMRSNVPVGAALLGAHCEGPYLHPEKKGAHAAEFMLTPSDPESTAATTTTNAQQAPFESLYHPTNLSSTIKMITIAPELPNAISMIASLHTKYPHIRIAIGHTTATYAQATAAVTVGASMVTHAFNAMNGWTGREPGVVGLFLHNHDHSHEQEKGRKVFFSTIADGVHLHPLSLSLAIRSGLDSDGLGGGRCIGITDAIELAGLEDGVYKGNGQIVGRQVKEGNRVVKEGTGTLIGSCVLLDAVVREMVGSVPSSGDGGGGGEEEERGRKLVVAVKAVSQNVADLMGEAQRGRLEIGRRADFAVLDWDGHSDKPHVKETWVAGCKVFDRAALSG